MTLTPYELAELAAEQDYADRVEAARDAAAEVACHDWRYRDGGWSLGDWLDYTGRELADYMPAAHRQSTLGMSQ